MFALHGKAIRSGQVESGSEGKKGSAWIDDALGETKGEAFDVDEHRQEMIDDIGDVFRDGDGS